jgi:hypothetical protein
LSAIGCNPPCEAIQVKQTVAAARAIVPGRRVGANALSRRREVPGPGRSRTG